MRQRIGSRFAVAAVAAAMAWVAVWSWSGLVEQPSRFVWPALFGAVLVVLVGAGIRSTRAPWPVALLAQVVVLGTWLQHRQGTESRFGGWVPTPDGISGLLDQVQSGASQVNRYTAPVDVSRTDAPVYLLAVAVLLILGVDLIAAGLRRAPWSGLPVIVALTVPISVLDNGLPALVFLLVGVLFALLLATAETDRVLAWGQDLDADRRADTPDARPGRTSITVAALRIAMVTAVGALVLPILVPVGSGVLGGDKDDGGGGGSNGNSVVLSNPLVDLRRDLVRNDHLPLLDVRTDAPDPSYLRTSVLDRFTGKAWQPASRDLSASRRAAGELPAPPGVAAVARPSYEWTLNTTPRFKTSWLPTPYVTEAITIDTGEWRYSPNTMDVASAETKPPAGVGYDLTATPLTYDATQLNSAPRAPLDIQEPMTRVPELLDSITEIAKDVTATGDTDYAKAVLLQDWFRSTGGFEYSLATGSGAGMRQLERFITTEKSGYCEQFAAAMAVMARALDIPARVVVGFLNPSVRFTGGKTYRYTTDDLHAWPEIYFSGAGWVRFEPTPSSRTGTAPSWTSDQIEAPDPSRPTATPTTALPVPSAQPKPVEETTTVADEGSWSPWPLVLVALLIAVPFVIATPALLRRAQRRRRLAPSTETRNTVLAAWAELRATAIDLKLPWPDGRSVRVVVAWLLGRTTAQRADVVGLEQLAALVERARYSREFALDEAERAAALATVTIWSGLLTESVPRRRARFAKVLPRSVLDRSRVADEPVRELVG
ncbi:transglutaminase domain-containing protein [Nocardioides marmoriginsengisoli]|uniref:Transglutaminase domain-containing protein n=1 Tax=Nocardioides marmoriginsengisoli TaxID=661483 RepID=A0A3N0CNT5_9ACTN|nr:DUF3488 and transglutaminase-like domain-containing protein [Nocardioides marmoriginsengisoli]RNL65010.1 transglutaminase domain-containing protein [Nocardioides marmoriginsengisoli]